MCRSRTLGEMRVTAPCLLIGAAPSRVRCGRDEKPNVGGVAPVGGRRVVRRARIRPEARLQPREPGSKPARDLSRHRKSPPRVETKAQKYSAPVTSFVRTSAARMWPVKMAEASGGSVVSPPREKRPDGMNDCDADSTTSSTTFSPNTTIRTPTSGRRLCFRSWNVSALPRSPTSQVSTDRPSLAYATRRLALTLITGRSSWRDSLASHGRSSKVRTCSPYATPNEH